MTLLKTFKSARRVATPLLAIQTPDPALTMQAIAESMNGDAPPIFRWDIASGFGAANDSARPYVKELAGDDASLITNVGEVVCEICPKLPAKAIIFFMNAHRYVDTHAFAQGLWNLRDGYKSNRRSAVLLAPTLKLPAELAQDVLVLDEALPDEAAMQEIVRTMHTDASLPLPEGEALAAAVSAVAGLAAFPAEQAVAMSLTKNGLNVDGLWERKRQLISQTEGLSVWREGQTFADIAGYANIKTYMQRLLAGKTPPRCIVFIDEIEKHMGEQDDTSGVKSGMKGTLLTWMEDNQARGNIFIGPGGSGKSAVAKAVGNEGHIPTISFDLSRMQNSLVGASEQTLREALKVIDAVSQGHSYFIATCNKIQALSPELRRRFKSGTFFFDLPTREERAAIWDLYRNKLAIDAELPLPLDEGWTGAEIKTCCEIADDFRCSLQDASAYIVPLAVSASASIESLRSQAHGRFIDASHAGYFDRERNIITVTAPTTTTSREIHLED